MTDLGTGLPTEGVREEVSHKFAGHFKENLNEEQLCILKSSQILEIEIGSKV